MKKIGMVVAVEIEAVLAQYGTATKTEKIGQMSISVFENPSFELYVMHTGAGQIAAAAGTQVLISVYHVDMIVNFGIVGGLCEEMSRTKLSIIEKVVHTDFDTSAVDPVKQCQYEEYPDEFIPVDAHLFELARKVAPELMPVVCASSDKFIGDPEVKKSLHEKFGAHICDMEAAAVALTTNRNHIPAVFLKIVSDGLTDGKDDYWKTRDYAAGLCMKLVNQVLGELS